VFLSTWGLVSILIASAIRIFQTEQEEALNQGRQSTAQLIHDIRSPLSVLTVIAGDSEKIPVEHRTLLKRVIDRINDISQANIEKKSEVRTNAVRLDLKEISEAIDGLVREKEIEIQELKQISWRIEIPESLVKGISINFPKVDLIRILSNILNNSIEAINSVGFIQIEIRSDNNRLTISVVDDGHGVAPSHSKNIFVRGFSYGKAKGSGLGLFDAKRSVERFGGKVDLISEESRGTRVTISFPIR
jgi:signal transduction histidine kinase